jgi:hypothetical protein
LPGGCLLTEWSKNIKRQNCGEKRNARKYVWVLIVRNGRVKCAAWD